MAMLNARTWRAHRVLIAVLRAPALLPFTTWAGIAAVAVAILPIRASTGNVGSLRRVVVVIDVRTSRLAVLEVPILRLGSRASTYNTFTCRRVCASCALTTGLAMGSPVRVVASLATAILRPSLTSAAVEAAS